MPASTGPLSRSLTALKRHRVLLARTSARARLALALGALLLAALLLWQLLEDARQRQQLLLDQSAARMEQEISRDLRQAYELLGTAALIAGPGDAGSLARLNTFAEDASSRFNWLRGIGYHPKLTPQTPSPATLSTPDGGKAPVRDYRHFQDNDWNHPQAWLPASPRRSYLPWTFQAPAPGAGDFNPVGLDLLLDSVLAPSVTAALSSGVRQQSGVFRAPDGHRQLLLLLPLYDKAGPLVNPLVSGEQARGLATLTLDLDRLLNSALPNQPGPALQQQDADDRWRAWQTSQTQPAASLLPVLRANLSTELPVMLALSRPLRWSDLPPARLLAGLIAILLPCYLLWVIIALRQHGSRQKTRASDRLFREREYADVTLQAITDAVLTFDTSLTVEYLNPSARLLLGLRNEAAIGQPVHKLVRLCGEFRAGKQADPLLAALQCKESRLLPDSSYLIRPSGERLLVEGGVSPLFSRDGALIGAVLTFRDTAPRRQRMVAALEASEQRLRRHEDEMARVARINAMGEMASGIAHEINQPLTAIMSYCQATQSMLSDERPDMDMVNKTLDAAVLQAARAGLVIRRMREFIIRREQHPAELDINQVASHALSLLEYELSQHDIHLEQSLTLNLPPVMADTIQLEQVVINLLRNAIDALADVRPWGRLYVATQQNGDCVTITVGDNGPGIAPGLTEKIFEPFFSTKQSGMGLGLAICQTAVENMGGSLRVANKPSGGAEFTVELPTLNQTTAIERAGEYA